MHRPSNTLKDSLQLNASFLAQRNHEQRGKVRKLYSTSLDWFFSLSFLHTRTHTHTPVADVVSQALSPRHPFYNIHPSGVGQTHPYKHTQVFRCTAQGEEAGKQTEACSHEKRAMLSLLSLSPAGLAETQ